MPLRLLADVEEGDGPNQVLRENGQRRIVVQANGDGKRDMSAIVADVRRILATAQLPAGYSTQLAGTFTAQEEAASLSASCRWSRSRSCSWSSISVTSRPCSL